MGSLGRSLTKNKTRRSNLTSIYPTFSGGKRCCSRDVLFCALTTRYIHAQHRCSWWVPTTINTQHLSLPPAYSAHMKHTIFTRFSHDFYPAMQSSLQATLRLNKCDVASSRRIVSTHHQSISKSPPNSIHRTTWHIFTHHML